MENILFDFNQIICYNIIGGDIFNTAKAYVKFFYFLFCQLDKIFFLILFDFRRACEPYGLAFRDFGRAYETARSSRKFPYG